MTLLLTVSPQGRVLIVETISWGVG